jgi:hypothetical protein
LDGVLGFLLRPRQGGTNSFWPADLAAEPSHRLFEIEAVQMHRQINRVPTAGLQIRVPILGAHSLHCDGNAPGRPGPCALAILGIARPRQDIDEGHIPDQRSIPARLVELGGQGPQRGVCLTPLARSQIRGSRSIDHGPERRHLLAGDPDRLVRSPLLTGGLPDHGRRGLHPDGGTGMASAAVTAP